MTVAELIGKLQQFRPDLRVVTRGFDEAGIEDIETVEIRQIKFNDNKRTVHIGPHDEDPRGVAAVFIDF